MDPLLKQLRELPAKFSALPAALRYAILGGTAIAILVAVAIGATSAGSDNYQYAFTNLTTEDSADAAAALKAAGVPFRLESGGAALAVPASKVYDARLLLATAGLPRGGGVGFELFDRGDLGVSEFTQKVNLRRAIEGELARTVGKLAAVRSARVHLTLAEKGLYRDDDRKASAAVVLNLQPGRALGPREIQGIRHLVSSAVPSLADDAVTIVDGSGAMLTDSDESEGFDGYRKKLERDLQQRVLGILEPAVGQGAVIAQVTAALDSAEVHKSAELYDPDQTALRSERKVSSQQNQDQQTAGGVAGAAANQPLNPASGSASTGNKSGATSQDEVRNFEVSKTTTTTVERMPRLTKLSVAVLLDGIDGKPRTDAEIARLSELAKRAVGFDEERGDQLQISSAVFGRSSDEKPATPQTTPFALPSKIVLIAIGVGVLLLVLVAAFLISRGRKAALQREIAQLRPGARIADLEPVTLSADGKTPATASAPEAKPIAALPDPAVALREKARALAAQDPNKAAQLIHAWIAADIDRAEVKNA